MMDENGRYQLCILGITVLDNWKWVLLLLYFDIPDYFCIMTSQTTRNGMGKLIYTDSIWVYNGK